MGTVIKLAYKLVLFIAW